MLKGKNINYKNIAGDLAVLFVYIFIFFLPSVQKIATISLFIAAFFILINIRINELFSNLFKSIILLLPVMFYFMHLIGVLYSKNLSFALFDLEVKASFLFLPLLFVGINFRKYGFKPFTDIFIFGNVFAVLYCMIYSLIKYFQSGSIQVFFYEEFSFFLHPSYFSLYLSFAIVLVLDKILYFSGTRLFMLIQFLILFLFFLAIALLTSRTGIVVTLFSILFFSFYTIYYEKKYKKIFTGKIIIALFLFILCLFTLTLYDRFSQLENEIEVINEYSAKRNYSRPDDISPTRIQIWVNSLQLVKKYPFFGVGTGDIRDELNKIFIKNDITYLNAHNQYLQTTAALGLIGLIILVAMLFFPLIFFNKSKKLIPVLFFIIVILYSMTESILERQAGVLFFIFFYVILYEQTRNEDKFISL